jgi:hypothetical protein
MNAKSLALCSLRDLKPRLGADFLATWAGVGHRRYDGTSHPACSALVIKMRQVAMNTRGKARFLSGKDTSGICGRDQKQILTSLLQTLNFKPELEQ